jgi:outer membrane protein assembly factor BamB
MMRNMRNSHDGLSKPYDAVMFVRPSVSVVCLGVVLLSCTPIGDGPDTPRQPTTELTREADVPAAAVEAPISTTPDALDELDERPGLASDWPTYQGDQARTGSVAAPVIETPRIRWKQHIGIQGYLNSPLVIGSMVVVPSSGRAHNRPDPKDGLHALDMATGKPKWHVQSALDANGSTYGEGLVVFTSDDQTVRAVDPAAGEVRWTITRESTVYSTPLVIGGTAVVGDASGAVVGISMKTGDVVWAQSYAGAIRGGLASDGARIYVVSQGGDVAALDSAGQPLWQRAVTRPGFGGGREVPIEGYNAPVVDAGRLIVPFARDTYYGTPALVALDVRTGAELWRASPGVASKESWGNLRSSPAVHDGMLVWAEAYSGDVTGLDVATGRVRFRRTVGTCLFPQYASPAVAGNVAYVPRQDGTLNAITLPGGTLRWSIDLGDSRTAGTRKRAPSGAATRCSWDLPQGHPLYAPPAIAADGTVFVGSGEGYLYAIEDAAKH